MTKEEHLLTILAEECVEAAQRVTKILRFGFDEVQANQPKTNVQRLEDELYDVLAMWCMLAETGRMADPFLYQQAIEDKKKKVAKYMKMSQALGTLEVEDQ